MGRRIGSSGSEVRRKFGAANLGKWRGGRWSARVETGRAR